MTDRRKPTYNILPNKKKPSCEKALRVENTSGLFAIRCTEASSAYHSATPVFSDTCIFCVGGFVAFIHCDLVFINEAV